MYLVQSAAFSRCSINARVCLFFFFLFTLTYESNNVRNSAGWMVLYSPKYCQFYNFKTAQTKWGGKKSLCLESYVVWCDCRVYFNEISNRGWHFLGQPGHLWKERDQIREERATDQLHILFLCVVERNFIFLGTLEAADGFPSWEREVWKKTRVMGRDVESRPWGQSCRWGSFSCPQWTASDGCTITTDCKLTMRCLRQIHSISIQLKILTSAQSFSTLEGVEGINMWMWPWIKRLHVLEESFCGWETKMNTGVGASTQ